VDVGGPVSTLKAADLKSHGIDIAIHPSLARGVFGFAMQEALKHLVQHQSLSTYGDHMFSSAQYNQALGLDAIRGWEEALSNGKQN
jgi:2-methylisocitrate lyase-like PEP mutase family enzyme